MASRESSQTVPSNNSPYSDLPSISSKLFEAKARKGYTFDQIAKALGKDEVWVAAAFYGQVCHCGRLPGYFLNLEQAKFSTEELKKLSEVLDISTEASLAALGNHWWPNRGLGPMPPTDPVIYRLYEARHQYIFVNYGVVIFTSLAGCPRLRPCDQDCTVNIQKKPDPKGDRVVLTFECVGVSTFMTLSFNDIDSGKFLPYKTW
ncbi:hypothetical protein H0H87_004668 [Tephrocybe sp. NHM501043]|nr:hypothetical protein H0H87_004668 [Tephrocybe sp. NHM501043]